MNSGIGHQICLELGQINVERAVKSKRSCDWWHDLTNQTIQIFVGGIFNIKVTPTDVVNSFVVNHKGTVWMLQCCMCCENGVVWFYNSSGNLKCQKMFAFYLSVQLLFYIFRDSPSDQSEPLSKFCRTCIKCTNFALIPWYISIVLPLLLSRESFQITRNNL